MSNKLKAALAIRAGMLATVDKAQELIETKNVTGDGPMDASGRAKNSLMYKRVGNKYQLISDMPGKDYNYIRHLEHGRKPGTPPPVKSIMNWIEAKGITPRDGGTKKGMAYAIATKIGKEGTKLHRKGGNSGLISFMQDPNYIEEMFLKPIEQAIKQKVEEEFNEMTDGNQ